MADQVLCSVPNCNKRVLARGWCNRHYLKWRKCGSPEGTGTSHGDPIKFLLETAINHKAGECILWPYAKSSSGHAIICISGRNVPAARYLCQKVNGNPPSPTHETAHSCGNGHLGCVHPSHLRWATKSENEHDKVEHGTSNRGERCAKSKLTRETVEEIRSDPSPIRETADKFGITFQTVSDIKRRKSWAWL